MASMTPFLVFINDNALLASGALCLVLAAALLVWLAFARRRRLGAPVNPRRDDFAKMLILFQTMRDLLEQQKELAQQLNEAIDAKVRFVRERVDAAQHDLSAMRNSVEELARSIADLRREAGSVIPLPTSEIDAASRDRSDPEHFEMHMQSMDDVIGIGPPPTTSELRLLALPDEDEEDSDRLDAFVGLDLGDAAMDLAGFEVPDIVPDKPEDAESARQVFKSLLSDQPPTEDPEPIPAAKEPLLIERGPNGATRITPSIKGRVLEYSQAGMTISQIAKELGIGKGEVRLILSLRNIEGK